MQTRRNVAPPAARPRAVRTCQALILALVVLSATNLHAGQLDELAPQVWGFAATQLAATVAEAGTADRFPRSTLSSGAWQFKSRNDWTSGFFPGCLWLLYEATGDAIWQQRAEMWTAGVEQQQFDTGSHDVGFQIFCSFGNGWRLTQNPTYDAVIHQGAASLATRFNATVGCTRSWNNWHFPVIVDNMMNLEILYWSAGHGGSTSRYDIALSHGLRSRLDHVRADGSTFHLIDYNPSTGAILDSVTVQGYSDESTWARGQAWGLYGFTMSYRESGDARFLATARALADYFLDHLPPDLVPYWDFQAPNIPNEPKDTSAAAIAASGLLELSTLAGDPRARTRYWNAATDILLALCSPAYLAEGTSSHGILLHGVGNKPAGTEVDVSLIYGDYYFLQALLRWRAIATDAEPGRPTTQVLRCQNPLRPGDHIQFETVAPGPVTVRIFDARGTEVRCILDRVLPLGRGEVVWDGRGASGDRTASGVYFVRLQTPAGVEMRKAVLLH